MSLFKGKNGHRLLLDALRQQQTLGCSDEVISKVARAATIKKHPCGSRLIFQDSDDNSLAFILRGSVEIFINERKVADRTAGQHIGEMSVIDPKARRSATVIATTDTEVAWVEEKDFSKIAQEHPDLWRALAIEIADRLRKRGALVRDRNTIPEIFIGSSSESLQVAKAIKRAMKADAVKIKLWDQGVFGASEATIESLEKVLPSTDFAILILSADDKIKTRQKKQFAPRDNVVFELGLFMGAIGRNRTFMLVDKKKKDLRLPPDLHGVTYLPLETKKKKPLPQSVANAVTRIRERVTELHTR